MKKEFKFNFAGVVRSPIVGCRVLSQDQIFEDKKLHPSDIIEAETPQGLNQAIGYMKYNAAKEGYDIVMRGQNKLYGSIIPSLFRHKDEKARIESLKSFEEKIQRAKEEFGRISENSTLIKPDGEKGVMAKTLYEFLDVQENVLPALLQHYGLSTPWLDVVDNIWTALWFSCWKCTCRRTVPESVQVNVYPRALDFEIAKYTVYKLRSLSDKNEQYKDDLSGVRKFIVGRKNTLFNIVQKGTMPEKKKKNRIATLLNEIEQGMDLIKIFENGHLYCYIILIRIPKNEDCIYNVDLRKIIPSYYLRPHIQHGIAIKFKDETEYDFSPYRAGIIRIPLYKALQWLGNGETFSLGTVFPSPAFDYGLKKIMGIPTFSKEVEIPTP